MCVIIPLKQVAGIKEKDNNNNQKIFTHCIRKKE